MDDFEEQYDDEQERGSSVADDIKDAKDTYDDFKDYNNKYKDYKSSKTTPKTQVSKAPTDVTPTSVNSTTALAETGAKTATAVSETAAPTATAVGETASGATAGGAVAGGAAAGGAAGGTAAAVGGSAAAGPVGWVIGATIIAVTALKKELEKRKNENSEQKVKRTIRNIAPLLILAAIILLPMVAVIFTFSIGYTVTTYDSVERVDEFITCLESNSTCSDITGLKLKKEVNGYGKPLVLFTKSELIEAAKTYSEFSKKYFETGEGFFIDDYSKVKEDFGLPNDYNLEKEELDSAVLANFFSLEARAFSLIDWIEVTWDDERQCTVEKPVEEFDVFYDSSKDTSIVEGWFSWLLPDNEKYVIRIPSVKKYSVSKTKVTTKTETSSTSDGESSNNVSDSSFDSEYPTDEQITPEYKQKILESYINRVKTYLPQWYEPYSVYLATGNVEYAKKFYHKFLNLLDSGDFKITVKLYHQTSKVKVKETTKLEINTTVNGNSTTQEKTINTESITTNDSYNSIVYSGPDTQSLLVNMNVNYKKEYNVEEEPKHIKGDIILSKSKIKDEEGKEIGETTTIQKEKLTETFYEYRTRCKVEGENRSVYSDLLDKENKKIYKKNVYANLRLAYVYYKICQDDEIDFNIDNIGPALEVVKEYYNNSRKSESNVTIPGGSSGEPAQPGVTNPDGGWRSTYTNATSGITYNQYTQDEAWYSSLQYGSWGTFGSYGCPITAASIFLQGYGINIDPGTLYQKVGVANPAQAVNWYLGKNVATSLGFNKDTVISQLEAGYPVSIHVPVMGQPLTVGYHGEHYMTLIDYDSKTSQVYLSTGNTGMVSGWYDINSIGIAGLTVDTIYYIPEGSA